MSAPISARILVVDDSITVRMDLQESLADAGLPADVADSLTAARAALAAGHYGLLILDVNLPDGDGVDFLTELRADPAQAGLRVMLLSSESEVRHRIRGLRQAADDYVGKPYAVDYIVGRASEFLLEADVLGAPLILAIDDSATLREQIKSGLTEAGYRVVTASSGEEGLQLALRLRPDAVVTDAQMPGIGGDEVVRRLRLEPSLRGLPCILLTGSPNAPSEEALLEAGADAYVLKDDSLDVLRARLAALLRSRTGARSSSEAPKRTDKLLLVDDNLEYGTLMAEQFRNAGYDVVLAASGEEALDLLTVETVDAALIDLRMAGISGVDVCRRIKDDPRTRSLPVLVLSARDDSASTVAGLAAGADDYLSKSAGFDVIRARLRAQMRRKQFEDENRRALEEQAKALREATEAQAARALAAERAEHIAELEAKNAELEDARIAAEDAARAKAAFLAMMSHEIRTPMNAIIGMTELLRGTPLQQRQREYVETISSGGTQLLGIINDILDFSKIESGHLELDEHSFNLRTLVEEVLDMVSFKAAERNIELVYEHPSGTPDGLIGDGGRVRQILTNYLSNAVKFTAEGEVVVTVTIGRELEDGRVELRFAVRDTGIGIPEDRMDRLFQAFSQVDASTTRHFGGTGLGLAICKRLAELMGGRVWAESSPGEGSTFYSTLVARTAELPPANDEDGEVDYLAGRRLLVVDDNDTNRRILRENAEIWRMRVDAASSGEEALRWLDDGREYDLAVLDYHMPGMDGVELAKAMREHPRSRHLPLVLAASASDSAIQGVGFEATLTKPVRQSSLRAALLGVLSSAQYRQAPRPAPAPRDDAPQPDAALRILLVEDNVVNQKVATLMLQRLGHDGVQLAGNGIEALKALERDDYDLVLMDMQMPEMDGYEATRRLRRQLPSQRQPWVVAMTAHALAGDRAACLAAGTDDYLSKPVTLETLHTAIARVPRALESAKPVITSAAALKEPEGFTEYLPSELARVSEMLDPEGLRELVEVMARDAPGQLAELASAAARRDLKTASRSAHTLKALSATVAAQALGECWAQLERELSAGAWDVALPEIEPLSQRYQGLMLQLLDATVLPDAGGAAG